MQPDPTALEATADAIADALAEVVAKDQARTVELAAGGATVEDAARIGAGRGRHGFIGEFNL